MVPLIVSRAVNNQQYHTNMANLRITSFNCAGVLGKISIIIQDLCSNNDIILLQETWITPDNLNALDIVSPDFCSHSISAVNIDAPVVGWPHGAGLTILWRHPLALKCSIKLYGDTRILGIELENRTQKFMILNVYLPYYSADNYDLYLDYIGKIACILEEYDHSDVMIHSPGKIPTHHIMLLVYQTRRLNA